MSEPEDSPMNCDICGEFECDIDHDDEDGFLSYDDDVSIYGYDGECS